jgi:serine/threonine protein kinase/tetratricopeptide (TPR) repeat protein
VTGDELPNAPSVIGPYRVLHSIARGGTGHVMEVEDPATGEHLALKLLMHTGASLPRFYREYDAMIRLNHPNIIRVFHFGLHEGLPWQTMELVTGTPVQAYIMRKGRPGDPNRLDEVVRLGHDIAGALHHIHRRGLVHRDLKSANLLVLPDGRIKLIDFGSVRVLDGERLTREGDFVGTFAYASPEQLVAAPVDGRSDLYSLGVLLYRLCTGRRPFEHTDPIALARMHLRDQAIPPRELFPTITVELSDLVMSLLAKRRDQRPPSGKAVARRLEEIAGRPLVLPGTLELEDTGNRLVGREAQQSALRAFMAAKEPGSLVVVEGLEGSGRHSMLQSLSSDGRNEGWLAYRAVLSPGKDLVSVALLLRQVMESLPEPRTPTIDRARALLETLAQGWDVRSASRREALQKAGTILFRANAEHAGTSILVVLEALHNAGPVVLEWLDVVMKGLRTTQTPVLFAAGVDPGRDRAVMPLRERYKESLWVRLPTLDAHQVGMLVGALLHRRPPPPTIAGRIHAASGGLPMYVEGVVRNLVQSGLLQEQGKDPNRLAWVERQKDLQIPVPAEARDLVMQNLAPLPAVHRRALEALSLLDDEASAAELAAGLGWDLQELQPVLAQLREQGWLEPGGDGPDDPISWRQILARGVVLDQCNSPRQRIFERLLGVALQDAPPGPAQVKLLLAIDRVDEAIESALVQAEHLMQEGRPVTALELLDPVVRAVKKARRAQRDRLAKLFLLHAEALVDARPMDAGLHRSLKRAESLGTGDDFKAELVMVRASVQQRIGHLSNYRKHLGEAWTHAQHADANLPVSVQIAVELGLSHLRAGAGRAGSRWFHQALRVGQAHGERRLVAFAEAGLAHLRYARGELTSAEVASIAALELFDKLGDTEGLALALPVWADVLRQQGRFSDAIDMINTALPTFRRQENPSPYIHLLVALAWLEIELCRLGRAQECIDELAATVSTGEHLVLRLEAHLVSGRILLASDNLKEAAHLLGEVCNLANTAGLVLIAEHARALLAETLWHADQQEQASKLYKTAVRRIKKTRDVPTLLEVCRSRGRVAAEIANPDDLFEPVREVLEREPAELARIEWLLASARHRVAAGMPADQSWKDARRLLREMSSRLNQVDRSALRVHPWARSIRQNLDSPDTVIP